MQSGSKRGFLSSADLGGDLLEKKQGPKRLVPPEQHRRNLIRGCPPALVDAVGTEGCSRGWGGLASCSSSSGADSHGKAK